MLGIMSKCSQKKLQIKTFWSVVWYSALTQKDKWLTLSQVFIEGAIQESWI